MNLDLVRHHTLRLNFLIRRLGKFSRYFLEGPARILPERLLDRLLADAADVGKPHAIGRQQRREWMDQHAGHAERVGNEASVLAASATETIERVARNVVTALHRDFLDRVRHVLDGDLDEAVGDLFGLAPVADLFRQRRERDADRLSVERLILTRPEYLGEEIGQKLPDHHIGVGDSQRPATPITLRAGIGAGRIRSDAKPRAVIMQDRATAGSDGVDQHHRRAHAHARDFGLEGALVFAGKMRHVGRGAAHVEADQPIEAGLPAGLCHADDAARRAGQDRVLAAE